MLVNLVIFFHGCCGVWPSRALFIHTCFMKGNCKDRTKRKVRVDQSLVKSLFRSVHTVASRVDVLRLVTRSSPKNVCVGGYPHSCGGEIWKLRIHSENVSNVFRPQFAQRILNTQQSAIISDICGTTFVETAVCSRKPRAAMSHRLRFRKAPFSKCVFTITAEIHARSLANFYGEYAERHMNLKFMRRVSERARAIRQFIIVKNKVMSVFYESVLLLTMNFVITLSK